jgi:poly-gamma-glutamate synthesis protein (capsule biosynthesis protein)
VTVLRDAIHAAEQFARRLGMTALAAVFCLAAARAGQAATDQPFPSLYAKPDIFSKSIEAARAIPVHKHRVSGLTVPHHLLAADLMARGFLVAKGQRYDKIVILFPDHFKKTKRPFATTRRPFETVFGPIPNSEQDTSLLLGGEAPIADSDLFAKDHGIGALLPYVRYFFPDTPVVPIAVSISSTREHWEALIAALDPVVTRDTLILQSTDYSHYLTRHEAVRHDQQTLNVIASGDMDGVAKLLQPPHLDSRGSQYIQMRLQEKHFGSRPLVIANKNSQDYASGAMAETTSYMVQVYPEAAGQELIDPQEADGAKTYCFAGDTFFGRYMLKLVSRPEPRERLRKELESRLAGCKLILNLEGVTVDELPSGLGPLTLAMPENLTVDWLKALNVVAVSVANNHAKDLGEEAYARMVAHLRGHGIAVAEHGGIIDLGAFRLAGLTDLDNSTRPFVARIGEDDLQAIGRADALPPLAAFLHWGREYQPAPHARQTELAGALRQSGVSLIVGAHPHQAYTRVEALAGGETAVAYSLGNFLFDQFSDRASGAILEVRFFPQGTFFARLVPMPNFYEMAHGRAPARRERQAGQ